MEQDNINEIINFLELSELWNSNSNRVCTEKFVYYKNLILRSENFTAHTVFVLKLKIPTSICQSFRE